MIRCYIVPYREGSNEHYIVPADAANRWDVDRAVAVVSISSEQLDVLRGQYSDWCAYQDTIDELLQQNRGTG